MEASAAETSERTLYEGHPNWRSILTFYVQGIVLAVLVGVIVALAVSTGTGVGVALGIFVVAIVVGLLKRIGTKYRITDQRLYIKHGLLSRREQHTRLERVQNVNTSQSFLQRVLGIGTVDFDTAGTDDSDFTFVGVANPRSIVAVVDEAIGTRSPRPTEPGP
jgi:uncharacterized membrane protein YdbT with pleckstrin-like domain